MGEPKDDASGVSAFKDNASKNDAYTVASVSDRDAPPATVTPSVPPTPPATSPSSMPTTPPAPFAFSNEDARRQPGSDLAGCFKTGWLSQRRSVRRTGTPLARCRRRRIGTRRRTRGEMARSAISAVL